MYSCNDQALKILGIGIIILKMHDDIVQTIQEVQRVKGLKKKLLSIGQLEDLGCKIEVQNKKNEGNSRSSCMCEKRQNSYKFIHDEGRNLGRRKSLSCHK